MIACVRLPHFAASLEERAHPELAGQPAVLVEAAANGQQVYGVSAEAARAGIRPGMALAQARARSEGLLVRPAAPSRYSEAFDRLLDALTTFTPQVEPEDGLELRADARRWREAPFLHPLQMDDYPAATCYLDLGKLRPDAVQPMAQQVRQCIHAQLELPAKIGLAGGKFTARVAATAVNPDEFLVVPMGQEADFLAGFTVALLPVDGETLRQLDLLGLYTLGQIAALPPAALLDRFGKAGRAMHRLANGRDTSPVGRYTPPVVKQAACSFEAPLADWGLLNAALHRLVVRLSAELSGAGQGVRQVTLRLAQDDGTALERALVLRQSSAQPEHLQETVMRLAHALPLSAGVTDLELIFSSIEPSLPRQLSLFERDAVAQSHLSAVLHDLVTRYGGEHFYWMCAVDVDARLPERRFRWEKADAP